MVLILFGFWLLLEGRVDLEIALVGLALSGAIYLFAWRALGYQPKREWAYIRRLPALVRYVGWLIAEVFRSGWAVIRLIWSPRLVAQPKLTSFRTRLQSRSGRVVLANSITMTPGTITVDIRGDRFLVHCLDTDFSEGLGGDMEERIAKVEAPRKGEVDA